MVIIKINNVLEISLGKNKKKTKKTNKTGEPLHTQN